MSNQRAMKRKMAKEAPPQVNPMEAKSQAALDSVAPKEGQKVSPEKMQMIETMKGNITDLLYREETKGSLQKMLQAGSPNETVPAAVETVFGQFEQMASKSNGPLSLELKLAGGLHAFNEVMELGTAMGVIPEDLPEENVGGLLEATMKKYIQKGLKDKSIDPIELQTAIEPMLSGEEAEVGMNVGRSQGVPGALNEQQSQEGLMQKRMAPLELENATLKKSAAKKGALQGPQAPPPEQGGNA